MLQWILVLSNLWIDMSSAPRYKGRFSTHDTSCYYHMSAHITGGTDRRSRMLPMQYTGESTATIIHSIRRQSPEDNLSATKISFDIPS